MRKLAMTQVRTNPPHWEEPLPGAEHGEVVYEMTREDWSADLAG